MGKKLQVLIEFLDDRSPIPRLSHARLNLMLKQPVASYPEQFPDDPALVRKAWAAIKEILNLPPNERPPVE